VTFALVLFALWLLSLLPVLALCKAAALGDQIGSGLLPIAQGVDHSQHVALRGTAARGVTRGER
jgi:hypothetical protein